MGVGALEFLSEELKTEKPDGTGEEHLGHVARCRVPVASLLFLLRLCVDLVWFVVAGGCLVEIVATSLPTPDPLGSATGQD